MSVRSTPAGQIGGQEVTRFQLSNPAGIEVTILTYGAIIQKLLVPGRSRKRDNIVLGYATAQEYRNNPNYFGCVAGRCANRISNGRFTLDGREIQLDQNVSEHTLHGGSDGFHARHWTPRDVTSCESNAIRLTLKSPDGDQGFPGTLDASVTYTLTACNRLLIDYHATTDQPTIINLTQHSYFNLDGEGTGSVLDHLLSIESSQITPMNDQLIVTGELTPIDDTPHDFRIPQLIGRGIRESTNQLRYGRGYDHNYVLDQPRGSIDEPAPAATLMSPRSGRTLRISTTEPGVQFYAGNFLDGSVAGTSGRTYRQSDGVALETQHFPDAPNHPGFPSIVLRPGQEYRSRTVWEFDWQPDTEVS